MSQRPVNSPYTISTEFGVRDIYAKFGRHSGVDYAVATGRQVFAPRSGQLTNVVSPTGGYMVVIWDGAFYHRLMHNSSFTRANGPVNEGQEVARSGGAKGTAGAGLSTGPHVHWDINSEGTYPTSFAAFIPPADWLAGAYESRYPQALKPNQRILENPTGVNQRVEPNTSSKIILGWPYDQEPFTFKGYVIGEMVNGNNVWYVGGITGGYFWSGAFKDKSTNGLDNLTPLPTPTPTPTPTPIPTPTPYLFLKELDVVTEVIPAGLGSFEYGNFPDSPAGIVIHDFGTDGLDTYESTINWFRKINNISAHFVISRKRKTQMVSLKDRAYHAGPNGNMYIGIELDPLQDPDTVQSAIEVIKALEVYYNKPLAIFKHSSIMPTKCGDDFELSTYDLRALPLPQAPDLEKRVTVIEEYLKTIKEFK